MQKKRIGKGKRLINLDYLLLYGEQKICPIDNLAVFGECIYA